MVRARYELAKTFKDDRHFHAKAEHYEDLIFERFGLGDDLPWFTNRRKLENTHPYSFEAPYRKGTVADAAIHGGHLLAALCWKYSETTTESRIGKVFQFIENICTSTDIPGLVVRGYVPLAEIERAGWRGTLMDVISGKADNEDKWYKHQRGYWYRADASPGQFLGVVEGLWGVVQRGPEHLKPRARELLEDIGKYLVKNNYLIVDLDGELTQVPDFGYDFTPIIEIPDGTGGKLGYYINSRGEQAFLNRAGRRLILLAVMRACAGGSMNDDLIMEYLRLSDKFKDDAKYAGFNINLADFLGVVVSNSEVYELSDPGQELNKTISYTILTDQVSVPDYYVAGFERVWDWYRDYRHPIATALAYNLSRRGLMDTPSSEEVTLSIEWLDSMPYPKRNLGVVNSSRSGVVFSPLIAPNLPPRPLAAPESIVPLWAQPRKSWAWSRDPRTLDADIDEDWGTQEFSYVDWVYAYWRMRYEGMIE